MNYMRDILLELGYSIVDDDYIAIELNDEYTYYLKITDYDNLTVDEIFDMISIDSAPEFYEFLNNIYETEIEFKGKQFDTNDNLMKFQNTKQTLIDIMTEISDKIYTKLDSMR